MKLHVTLVALAIGLSGTAWAQTRDHAAHHPAAATTAESAARLTDGEIRKVDKETQKLTIRHGAIENLGMPPMTMVFRVTDPAMLDNIKVGDKVRFAAEQRDGAITITKVERAG